MTTYDRSASRLSHFRSLIIFACGLAAAALPAHGQTVIPVTNPSFEDPGLADGAFANGIPDWFTPAFMGVQNFTAAHYPGGVADGENAAWCNEGGFVVQELGANYQAGLVYRLTIAVGERFLSNYQGYEIAIGTGAGAAFITLATTDSNSGPNPDPGTFIDTHVEFGPLAALDPLVGTPIAIAFRTLDGGQQGNFDDVRMISYAGGCQVPTAEGHGGSVGLTSDLNSSAGFTVADNFMPSAPDSITALTFWGFYIDFGGPFDCGPGTSLRLSEIRIDQVGSDVDEYVEIRGTPGTSLDDIWLVVIGDSPTFGSGSVDAQVDLTGHSIPADGHFLIAESTFTLAPGEVDLETTIGLENSDNVTFLLVRGYTGTADLDVDDDCVADSAPWAQELDRIALIEEENPPSSTECHYGPPTVGPDASFVPGHVYECNGSWIIGPFDPVGTEDTPGQPNFGCMATEEADSFQVTYYHDESGIPGAVLAGPLAMTIDSKTEVEPVPTGIGPVATYEYDATHAPVPVNGGACYWIQITNTTQLTCVWLWQTAGPGDGKGIQDGELDDYDTGDVIDSDLAFCLDIDLEVVPCPFEYACNATGSSPANDCCVDAEPVFCLDCERAIDTTNAETDGPLEPSCGSNGDVGIWKDVYYLYTAFGDGTLTVSTCNLIDFDSKIAIYDVPGGTLDCDTVFDNLIGCNDDCPEDAVNFSSTLVVQVDGGQTYLVRVGGFSSSGEEIDAASGSGTVSFNLATDPVRNITQGTTYSAIQPAINAANLGDVIEAAPKSYLENVDFLGKEITLRSIDPQDPSVVDETVIASSGVPVIIGGGVSSLAALRGFTITGANFGGMLIVGSPTVSECRFVDNVNSSNLPSRGWDADLMGGSPTFTNCRFEDGTGSGTPSAHIGTGSSDASVTLINCSFVGGPNSFASDGTGACTMINCTSSDFFGATISNGSATFDNCVMNNAFGLNVFSSATATSRSSFWLGGLPPEVIDGGGNIVDGVPLLDADLRLTSASPCLDAGDNALVPGAVTTDLDGNPRFADWEGDVDPTVDMGAFELPALPAPSNDACGAALVVGDGITPIDTVGATHPGPDEDCGGGLITITRDAWFQYQASSDCVLTVEVSSNSFIPVLAVYGVTCPAASGEVLDCSYPGSGTANVVLDVQAGQTYRIRVGTIDGSGGEGTLLIDCTPDTDADNDGVPLPTDLCPNTPPQVAVGPDGCPAPTNITNSNTGLSYDSVQQAINNTSPGDVITLAARVYNETIDFAGRAITITSSDPDDPMVVANTVIDGNSTFSVVQCVSGEGAGTVLEGVTITGGFTFLPGGGIFCLGSSPTISKCVISNNTANQGGGMANLSGSNPNVTDCTFIGNLSFANGAGMYNDGSDPTVTNCRFVQNLADDVAGQGGGMYNQSNSPTVTACTFIENTSAYGGGFYQIFGAGTITDCRFLGNDATFGGGMYCFNSATSVTNSIFLGNTSVDNAGSGLHLDGGSNAVTNCTFSGNTGGSAIRSEATSPTIDNCIIYGNDLPEFVVLSGSPIVSYSNIRGGLPGAAVAGGGAVDGGGNIDADPFFSDPDGADDMFGTEDDDVRLTPDSPSIDAGDNTAVPGGVSTDLDGNPRFVDMPATPDTGNGTPPLVDMGAYELSLPPCPGDTDGSGVVDVDDLVAVILDWGTDGTSHNADVDGSGIVDVDDLVQVILAWGLCN